MKKILTLFTALILFGSMTVKADITIKAKVPAEWTNAIHVFLYSIDADGFHEATQDGDWWSYTYTGLSSSINAIFVNGNDWNGNSNQTNDITNLSADACYEIIYNSTGKCAAVVADCSGAPIESTTITIKGKAPAEWTNNIHVYLYGTDADGFHATTLDGEWWSYTYTGYSSSINAIFVNGDDWNGNSNQTNDITNLSADACYEIIYNSTGKCAAVVADCSGAPIEPNAFVAGSEAEIFGTAWTTGLSANQMIWDEGLSKYKKVYTVDKAYKSVALKVVYGGVWYGEEGGESNVKFSLSGAGEFVVWFDKVLHHVTVAGTIVGDEQFDFGYVAVAGNGTSGNSWLNGENWNAATTANRMTEVSTNVYEISFNDVEGTECQFQFAFDGAWAYQFGGTFDSFGTATTAVYGNSGGNIVFTPAAGADITIRLDLSGFDFATKEGATFTVSQVAPVVTVAAQGGWDNWEASLNFIPDGSGLTATATKHFDAGNYDFKLIVDGNWLSNANAFHRFWTSASGITTDNTLNMQLQADADGDYVFTWTYATNAIAITFPETPKTGTNEVKFFPPRTEEHPWNEVYVYAWRRTGGENEQLTGDWPGIPATKDGEWYKATIAKGACVVFNDNNNGMQSFDIENVQKDVCYIANEIVDGDPIKAKFYESCTVNYFLTSGDEAIMGVGNAWKADLAERQLNGSNQITLSDLPAGIYEFKLTNGSWAWSLGGQEHLNSACSSAAVTSGNGNVKFKIESAQDVTISYNPATQKICLSAETVLPFEDVRTGMTADNYYTVCFNREMKQIRGASLWSFIGRDADYAYIEQESAPFEAGKPFILFAESEKLEAILDREVSAPVANGALHGTFSLLGQADLDGKKTAAGDKDVYLVIGNELRRATGASTGGNSLPAYRAYVFVDEIDPISTPSPAPGKKVRSMPMQKDQAQGFENIETSDKPMKVMIEGTLYILRGEKVYDTTGRMVE